MASFPSAALLIALALGPAGTLASPDAVIDPQAERADVSEWRARRVEALTSDSGWLTLTGLFWLQQGDNSFGRAPDNSLVLAHPALAEHCGTFNVSGHKVRFTAAAGSGVTAAGQPVSSLELSADSAQNPTVLASGTLRFYLIERAGKLPVRRTAERRPHAARLQQGLQPAVRAQ
ncbi:MAG TPA: hypothetical protein VE819_02330 [Steroidobacteraceae bacterium]|jgi:uncharacterized protein (DUF1684 family)|nr:hypothetical protein [Steroidobacteraceae bacterium]